LLGLRVSGGEVGLGGEKRVEPKLVLDRTEGILESVSWDPL